MTATNDFAGFDTDPSEPFAVTAADQQAWLANGFATPEAARPWLLVGIDDPAVAAEWVREDISPAEAALWAPLGLDPAQAREIRAAGMSSADVARTRAGLSAADPALTPDEMTSVELANPGIDL